MTGLSIKAFFNSQVLSLIFFLHITVQVKLFYKYDSFKHRDKPYNTARNDYDDVFFFLFVS